MRVPTFLCRVAISLNGAALARVVFMATSTAFALSFAQGTGPTESKGVTTKALGFIDLATEVEGLQGRQLRARLVTIEPGGRAGLHSHKDRPTMEYVLQGQVVEIRNGVEIPHAAGEMVLADHDVSHSWENRGTVPVVLLPVDVFKP